MNEVEKLSKEDYTSVMFVLERHCPNQSYVIFGNDYSTLSWSETNTLPKPTENEFNQWLVNAVREYDLYDYARQRKSEYPPLEDFVDAWVKDDTEELNAYRKKCLAVKAKYPKPSEVTDGV